ncbi:MAG: methyltransferase domain-containing protein [Ferruginibacter sp.]
MKLHLGSGKNIKNGYINIDAYVVHPGVENIDILNLPYGDETVDEIISEHVAEHIKFEDEEKFWKESYRVLKKGGKLICEVPDMEWLCEQFLKAEDDFKSFYQKGHADHYFGNGRSIEHRWGMITTHFFGNQNGEGQYHYNGYTKKKFISLSRLLGFQTCSVSKIFNKGAQALVAIFVK